MPEQGSPTSSSVCIGRPWTCRRRATRMGDMDNEKTALVTGTNKGIGFAIARGGREARLYRHRRRP